MEPATILTQRIYQSAEAMATQLLAAKGLARHSHLIDDAAQEIALAGLQNWQATQNIAFAKVRMRDRLKSWWLRYCADQRRQPVNESDLPSAVVDDGESVSLLQMHRDRRANPAEEAAVNDFIAHLNPRQQRILRLAYAGYENEQIAEELAVSVRTVERERSTIRKEYVREFSK